MKYGGKAREMAGLEAIEPPTKNISISGKSSSVSGCSSFQKPIVSHPPGEPKCATMGTSIIKRSGPPASNNRIFHLGFSERRAAKVQPAVPAPTIMKSYSPSIVATKSRRPEGGYCNLLNFDFYFSKGPYFNLFSNQDISCLRRLFHDKKASFICAMVASGQGEIVHEKLLRVASSSQHPNPREMAGFADMEPPTKNNSMSGQPSTASGWPKSQNAIASQPPGDPYGPSCLLNRYNQVDSEKSSKCRDVALVVKVTAGAVKHLCNSSHRCPIQPSGRSRDDYLVYTSCNLEQKSRPLLCLEANYSDYYSWPNKPVETVGYDISNSFHQAAERIENLKMLSYLPRPPPLQGIRSSPADLAEENLKSWQETAIIIKNFTCIC
uniref:Uncharacterized protein n=1 Tax=Glossina pallidipes TaxID=7398 RepID=A0A1A9Z4S5_GLOPL